jgi:hypothetical protein
MVKHIERKCSVQEPYLHLDKLQSYCPLLLFLVQSITLKLLVGIQYNFIHLSSTLRGSAVHKNHNSIWQITGLLPFDTFPCPEHNLKIMVGIQNNFIQWSSTIGGSAMRKNYNSVQSNYTDVALCYFFIAFFLSRA